MLIFSLIAALAAADVTHAAGGGTIITNPQGFHVSEIVDVKTPPERTYRAMLNVASWWDSRHTFSGSARNLSIDPRPGGCFCETLRNGGVQHMTIVNLQPPTAVTLRGALGPLQGFGVEGAMEFRFNRSPSGGTLLSVSYTVGGYMPDGGPEHWAPIVEHVLAEQTNRLARFADTGSPEPIK